MSSNGHHHGHHGHHHYGHKERHRATHHLSTRASDRAGWVEGITSLTEDAPATALLEEMERKQQHKLMPLTPSPVAPSPAALAAANSSSGGSTPTHGPSPHASPKKAPRQAAPTLGAGTVPASLEALIAGGGAAKGQGAGFGGGMVGVGTEQHCVGEQAYLQRILDMLADEVALKGEALVEVGSPEGWGPPQGAASVAQLEGLLHQLESRMHGLACCTQLRRRTMAAVEPGAPERQVSDVLIRQLAPGVAALNSPVIHPGTGASGFTAGHAAQGEGHGVVGGPGTGAHTRRIASPVEVRLAVIGNVDSGKSTLVGVLTRSVLDDGRGLARSKVFKHFHEEETGRTSSIGQHTLCLDSMGGVLNDNAFRTASCGDYVARAAKIITLVDLAGHERYFKTTAYGLTGHLPDYAALIVAANAGLVGMCKEHLGVALALKIPVLFIVTKVDIAPEHVLQHTLSTLTSILKKPGVRKRPYVIRTPGDVVTAARHMRGESLAPIILTSSVTGSGLELVRLALNLLPQRQNWAARAADRTEFIIDETFAVPGVGTVVAGTVKHGVLHANSTLLMGPDVGDGSFKPVGVKSIHYKRLPVARVVAGQTAALALKKVKRAAVRKGMVLVDPGLQPAACWEFDADIAILTHSTTIQPRYQAVIHCEIVRQAARVVAMDCERLRSGDRACVRFRFLQRPEYLTPGSRFVFREGRTKGIGMVVATHC